MTVSSSDAIIVSNSHFTSPITNLLKAITNLPKARVSHNLLKDRIESLRDDNSNKSGSKFQSEEEEHDKNDDISIMINQEATELSEAYEIDKKKDNLFIMLGELTAKKRDEFKA